MSHATEHDACASSRRCRSRRTEIRASNSQEAIIVPRPPHPRRGHFKNAPEDLPDDFTQHRRQVQAVAQRVDRERVEVTDVQYSYGKSVLLHIEVERSREGERALVAFLTEVQRQTDENPNPLIVTEPEEFWMSAEDRNELRPDGGSGQATAA
jgi:hypothetical protein